MNSTIPVYHLPAPAGYAPLRRLQSVRRTTSIDVTWPDGRHGDMKVEARGRDLYTGKRLDETREVSADLLNATIAPSRTILAISSEPPREGVDLLVGCRGGGHLRRALNDSLPAERALGSPLYLLVDDLAGASLVAGWAWTCWTKDHPIDASEVEKLEANREKMEGVCIGFSPGFESMTMAFGGGQGLQRNAQVLPLTNPDDKAGWHLLKEYEHVAFRRARRIDVWLENDQIRIHSGFQDSASAPEGKRIAVHEYTLEVIADARSQVITHIHATPHVLPFTECPLAVNGIQRLVGTPLADMRSAVLETLPKMLGCTHLNDAMRALAEVPVLYRQLT